ncbi:MAG: hypothetical protein ACLQBX_09840 [Candidatus Limnocylindrales bacterium]
MPLPRAKSTCKACREPLWVRSGPDDKRHILSLGDLPAFEQRWADTMRDRAWERRIRGIDDGATRERVTRELAAKSPGYTLADVYWATAEAVRSRLEQKAARGEPAVVDHVGPIVDPFDLPLDLGSLCFHMAGVLWEEAGEPRQLPERAVRLMREGWVDRLRGYARIGYTRVEIVAPENCCTRCRSKQSRLADELRSPTLPHNCERGWCGCSYNAALDSLPRRPR